jgi:hypothetical protein
MKNKQNNSLMDFYNQLPPELQEKIQVLPPEKQQEILIQLMQKYQQNNQQFADGGEIDSQQVMQMVAEALQQGMQPEKVMQMLVEQGIPQEQATQIIEQIVMQMQQQPEQQFQNGGETQNIPVEAERNENITVQNGQEPQVEGGYLEQQSYNPVTGQSTYEIPDNEHSETHDNGGVNMKLSEGDVINSDKTKIPIDFKVYGKNFKNKTFKDASDYLSKQESKIQDDFTNNVKEGKTDKVSESTLQILLAKLGKNRNELNELQEQVLESKKQKEVKESLKSGLAEYGKVIHEINKAEQGLNTSLDRYINYKTTDRPVLKAANGLNASLAKFEKFANQVNSEPNISIQEIMKAYKQSGLNLNTKENIVNYKPIEGSKTVGDFKAKIAQKETGAYKNPYIAIAGIGEKEASTHSFDELKSKAASSGLGKYQFIWNIHKNDIKRITGVSKPDDFRYNPKAQEQFMDWFRDKQLLPQATELKQKYNIPLSIEQLMAMVHLEGKTGLEKKIKAGTLKTSTMANNFKNASPMDYASQFIYGGKIYAPYGTTANKSFLYDIPLPNSKESLKLKDQYINYYRDKNNVEIPYSGDNSIGSFQKYLTKNYPEIIPDFMQTVPNTKKGIDLLSAGNKQDDDFYLNSFADDKWTYRSPLIVDQRNNLKFKIDDDYKTINGYQTISTPTYKVEGDKLNYYKNDEIDIPGQRYYKPPIKIDKTFLSQDEIDKFIADKKTDALDNKNYYYDVNTKTWIHPSLSKENITGLPPKAAKVDLMESTKIPIDSIKNPIVNETLINNESKKNGWLDKLNYGLRESLPYLRNLALMREDIIPPILQRKRYDNPYDNMNIDYSIQSGLNDADRMTLSAMSDSRGNPSVRNARMAQLLSNNISAKAPMYTQKYNQDQQLMNQKVMGQSQYRNQLDDVNRNYDKQFEHEVLQTREIQRQQKAMAIDNMMNDYLRKQEQNQAIDLSLLETNYDWNPYTGKYEFNKEKAERNFAEKKYLAKNSSSSDTSKIIEGADGESYEIITPKSGKPIIRKIEKKYGGKVVKY